MQMVEARRCFVSDRQGYAHLRSRVAGLPTHFDDWQRERELFITREESAGRRMTRVLVHRRLLADFEHWCTATEVPATADMLDAWLNAIGPTDQRKA